MSYNYYDDWKSEAAACKKCPWTGTLDEGVHETFSDLFEVNCPKCDGRLALVMFPTLDEMVRAAPKLSPLERSYNAAASRFAMRFEALKLRSPDQLPELEADALVLVWEGVTEEGHETTVIRHGNDIVWREPAVWEGYTRFEEILKILKHKYGHRLLDVVPAPSSELWLWGDRLGAPGAVDHYRAALRQEPVPAQS